MIKKYVFAAVLGIMFVPNAFGGDARLPTGLYFHEFTGTFDGSEWSTWGALDGEDRYEFSDLTAEGRYPGSIGGGGTITLDRNQGSGAFTSQDEAFIDFTISGGFNFHSEMVRAPHTDDRFPVFYGGPHVGDSSLSGEWEARVSMIDPFTGETTSVTTERFEVDVSGLSVRLTDGSGAFFQAAWFGDDQAGFRVIENPRNSRYGTFFGSDTSVDQNLVGELRVLDENTMTATLFFQTRAPLGSQVQTARYIELTRVPAPSGAALLGSGVLVYSRRRR